MAVANPVKYQQRLQALEALGVPAQLAQTIAEREVNDAVKYHARDHLLYLHLTGEITPAEYVVGLDFINGVGTKQAQADADQFRNNPNSPYAAPVTSVYQLPGPWNPRAIEHLHNLYGV